MVGHSLGGLVILDTLKRFPHLGCSRAVLIGSPCGGSRVVSWLTRWRVGEKVLGPCLREATQGEQTCAEVTTEVGVIAGDRSFGLGMWVPGLDKPHDGSVAVSETALPGARDRIVVRANHTQMLWSARVGNQVCHFLREGHFAAGRVPAER